MTDREVLRPYWEMRDKYLDEHPEVQSILRRIDEAKNRRDVEREKKLKRDPDYRRYRIETDRQKDIMRRRDPILDGTLVFWGYGDNPLTSSAMEHLYTIRNQTQLTNRIR